MLTDDKDILENAGKISKEIAKEHAETEYEKYRILQACLFNSDFDKMILDVHDFTTFLKKGYRTEHFDV